MRRRTAIAIAATGLILDQAVKQFFLHSQNPESGFFLIPDVLGIRMHLNAQFALSIPFPNSAAAVLMLLVIAGIAAAFLNFPAVRSGCGVWLVLAGALSNFADRVIYGGVVDYIAVAWGGVFNLADVLIIFGIILMVLPHPSLTHGKLP